MENDQRDNYPLNLLAAAALGMYEYEYVPSQGNVPQSVQESPEENIQESASNNNNLNEYETNQNLNEFTSKDHLNCSPSTSGYSSLASSLASSPDYEASANLSNQFFKMELNVERSPAACHATNTRNLKRKSTEESVKLDLDSVSVKSKIGDSDSKIFNGGLFKEETKIEVRRGEKVCILTSVIGKRKAPTKTPNHLKDEDYYIRRERNNLAAKRSRENRNKAIAAAEAIESYYKIENVKQKANIGGELVAMHRIISKMEKNAEFEESIMKAVGDHNLEQFGKVMEFFKANPNLILEDSENC